jgi:tRNA-splicing ligase RtcB
VPRGHRRHRRGAAADKDIDAVMAAQSDLVEVVHTLKQVLCVKG